MAAPAKRGRRSEGSKAAMGVKAVREGGGSKQDGEHDAPSHLVASSKHTTVHVHWQSLQRGRQLRTRVLGQQSRARERKGNGSDFKGQLDLERGGAKGARQGGASTGIEGGEGGRMGSMGCREDAASAAHLVASSKHNRSRSLEVTAAREAATEESARTAKHTPGEEGQWQ